MFLTLTYSEKNLPPHGSLNLEDMQKFLKRYRARIQPQKIRFLQCGEYGEQNRRAHHHCAIFNHSFADQVEIEKTAKGHKQTESPLLNELWGHGRCTIGELNFKSANYLARYIMKKITGPPAEEHYAELDPITGEVVQVKPEYISMSKKPGIGYDWIMKYMSDVYPSDELVIAGKITKPPAYYDKIYQKLHPKEFRKILLRRLAAAGLKEWDNTPDRREVKECVKKAQIKALTRI